MKKCFLMLFFFVFKWPVILVHALFPPLPASELFTQRDLDISTFCHARVLLTQSTKLSRLLSSLALTERQGFQNILPRSGVICTATASLRVGANGLHPPYPIPACPWRLAFQTSVNQMTQYHVQFCSYVFFSFFFQSVKVCVGAK